MKGAIIICGILSQYKIHSLLVRTRGDKAMSEKGMYARSKHAVDARVRRYP